VATHTSNSDPQCRPDSHLLPAGVAATPRLDVRSQRDLVIASLLLRPDRRPPERLS
jgi:hypothetical protein